MIGVNYEVIMIIIVCIADGIRATIHSINEPRFANHITVGFQGHDS